MRKADDIAIPRSALPRSASSARPGAGLPMSSMMSATRVIIAIFLIVSGDTPELPGFDPAVHRGIDDTAA